MLGEGESGANAITKCDPFFVTWVDPSVMAVANRLI
jgi:hypothetical protein